jgi:EAL and modified HD-GYP domain-containing signal transduction protein
MQAQATPEAAFIARQPILNRMGEVAAYELLFRDGGAAKEAAIVNSEDATNRVIRNALNEIGTHWLLNGHPAFVNLSEASLTSEIAELLPSDKIVVEILETVKPTPAVVARVRELRETGMRFALDDYVHGPAFEPLLDLVDFVKIDVLATQPAVVEAWIRELRKRPLQLLAEKVETPEQRTHAIDQGFDLMQGYYFARPENVCRRTLSASTVRIAQIIGMLRESWDPGAIESIVKHDPAITVKLLRFASAVDSGAIVRVTSIRQALVRLGPKKLWRWLTLNLVHSGVSNQPWIASSAVTRGRFCELLGMGRLDVRTCDDLFLVGLFSLLPAILQCDPKLLLDTLAVAAPISQALESAEGPLAPYLIVAESVETGDFEGVKNAAERIGVAADDVNRAHMAAIAWSEEASRT